MNSSALDIHVSKSQQTKLRAVFNQVQPITEYLGTVADKLKPGDSEWADVLLKHAPWLTVVAPPVGAGAALVGYAAKLFSHWTAQTEAYDIGKVALTLAYQAAARTAIGRHVHSVLVWRATQGAERTAAERIRDLPPAEAVDLSTFALDETARLHPFVRRADAALLVLLRGADVPPDEETKIFNTLHDCFVEELRQLLNNKETSEQFDPFRQIIATGAPERRAQLALQLHAEYQRALYAERPLFKREPYALGHVYAETECGYLDWAEIRRGAPPFDEAHGGRRELLPFVLHLMEDEDFDDAIIIQGLAGAGKSSFTLRLCAELLARGFLPIRLQLKRLKLGQSLYESLGAALEFEDKERSAGLGFIDKPRLLNRALFATPHGSDQTLCRYVLILDGWDELELSDSQQHRQRVKDFLADVRREFLGRAEYPRVRVVLTGRPAAGAVSQDHSFLQSGTPILTMRPLRPARLREFITSLSAALRTRPLALSDGTAADEDAWQMPPSEDFEPLLARYEELFQKCVPDSSEDEEGDYGPEMDAGLDEPGYDEDELETPVEPEPADPHRSEIIDEDEVTENEAPSHSIFTSSNLPAEMEVLGLPLLTYLTMRVLAELAAAHTSAAARQATINQLVTTPTLLYRRLTDLTCQKAGKWVADKRDTEDAVKLQARYVGAELREKLQRTAAAMTVLGQEFITELEWRKREVRRQRPATFVAAETEAEEHPLARLLVSFYFKGGQPEQSGEFAHKSFREYFFAECIVETLKDYGRLAPDALSARTEPWRDFAETDPRFDFSRALSELLAPQWLTKEVCQHLEALLIWELERVAAQPPLTQETGSPTAPLTLMQWRRVRDGLAALWQWWAEGAPLRPQIVTHKKRGAEPAVPYVHELLTDWMTPLAQEPSATTRYDPVYAADAHLGEGLCRLNAWVHWRVALAEGWAGDWRGRFRVRRLPEQPFQTCVRRVGVTVREEWVLFRPSGADPSIFRRLCARINVAVARLEDVFPTLANLHGIDLRNARLDGARLDGARLDGARLDGASLFRASFNYASLNYARFDGSRLFHASFLHASLFRASLDRASLNDASLDYTRLDDARLNDTRLFRASLNDASLAGADLLTAYGLTVEQLREIGFVDEETKFPLGEEFAQLKQELLRKQRERASAVTEEPPSNTAVE
jgi:hypothetical protein